MRRPEERSRALLSSEQQPAPRTGCSRRAFLLGAVSVGGVAAALAAGGWWLETHVFHPPSVSVDPHRLLSLPITTDLKNPNASLQYLEYTWFPDSTHLALAAQHGLFQVDVKTGQQHLVSSAHALMLLTHWSEDREQLLVEGLDLGPANAGDTHVVWPDQFHAYTLPFSDLELRLGRRRAVSPDETLVAVATTIQGNLSIQIWSIQEQRFVLQCQRPVSGDLENVALVWSPDSAALAAYTGGYPTSSPPTVQIWQVSDGRLLWQADVSHPGNAGTEEFGWLKWSPEGTALAYGYLAQTPVWASSTHTWASAGSKRRWLARHLTGVRRRLPGLLTALAWRCSRSNRGYPPSRSGTRAWASRSLPASTFQECGPPLSPGLLMERLWPQACFRRAQPVPRSSSGRHSVAKRSSPTSRPRAPLSCSGRLIASSWQRLTRKVGRPALWGPFVTPSISSLRFRCFRCIRAPHKNARAAWWLAG